MSSILRCAGSSEKTLSPPENKPWVILTVKQHELPKFKKKISSTASSGRHYPLPLYQFIGHHISCQMIHLKT